MESEIDLVRIALSKRWSKAGAAILDEIAAVAIVLMASDTGCLFYELFG
jgi:hypothetical protein